MFEKYPVFKNRMKKTYTILLPDMLPMHERLMSKIFGLYGYRTVVLTNKSHDVIEKGQKYVHNDACYPAMLVIGQFIDAIEKGGYDREKTALMITQTGGGCRASNYIFLLRKALKKAGYGDMPVLSFNLSGLDKEGAFKLSLHMLHRLLYAVLYGDLLMLLRNQTKPYEINPGESEKKCDMWVERLTSEMRKHIKYRKIRENYRKIIEDFASIAVRKEDRVRVGIVGEIFVKYSPLGNNNLEDFLIEEGAEAVVPGLLDFCLHTVYNGINDSIIYHRRPFRKAVYGIGRDFLVKKQKDVISAIKEHGRFVPNTPFDHTATLSAGFVGVGTKMGEGWLLTAEMVELIEMGVKNIVCTQPFGCLPNHIVGKGVMKPIKEKYPDANITAVDYDPSATKINQENRIKLMLANARKENAAQA